MSETHARWCRLAGALMAGATALLLASGRLIGWGGVVLLFLGVALFGAWRRSSVHRTRIRVQAASMPIDRLVRQALAIEQSSERTLERCRSAFIVSERSKDLGAADIWILGSQGARLPLEALRQAGCTTVASVLDIGPRELRIATGISKAEAARVRSACDALIRRNLAEHDGVPLLRPNSAAALALITAVARRRFVIESVAGYACALAGTSRTFGAESQRVLDPLTFGTWLRSRTSGDDSTLRGALETAETFLRSADGPRMTAVIDQAGAYLNDVVATLEHIDEDEAVNQFFDDPTSMRDLYRTPQQPLAMLPEQLTPNRERREWFGPRPGLAGLD